MQTKIEAFASTIKKPPPVTKSGLKEFLLKLIADADLVSMDIICSFHSYSILSNAPLSAILSDTYV